MVEQDSNTKLSNFVQGSLWQEYKQKYIEKTVIPYFLYYDDFGVNNQLGSHGRDQSIAGFYTLFPTIHPKFQSKLENILLVMLLYSSTLKEKGNHQTLKHLIQEINFLQENGIDIIINNEPSKVYFKLCLIIGDNVAVNGISEFVRSFSAFYTCRICRVHRDVLHKQLVEDQSLLRNRRNYLQDVNTNNVSLTGIHGSSIFNEVKDFHITDNVSSDIMHDFCETVVHYGICKSLKHFIYEFKLFDLMLLNKRKRNFQYGINDSANLGPEIRKEHIDRNKLQMSAAEMIIFTQYILLIIGDLVPKTNSVWLYLVNLVQIFDLIIYKDISRESCERLRLLITTHHKSYISLFNDHLRPTFHNMIHYPNMIYKIGPLKGSWCMRAEGFHRNFKIIANGTTSRKNIPITLAIKSQLSVAHRSINNIGFKDSISTGTKELLKICNISDIDQFQKHVDISKIYYTTNYIQIASKKIIANMILINEDCGYNFFKILHILCESGSDKWFLVTQKHVNAGFNSHYQAYNVVNSMTSYRIFTINDITNERFPTFSHKIPQTGENVVRITYY